MSPPPPPDATQPSQDEVMSVAGVCAVMSVHFPQAAELPAANREAGAVKEGEKEGKEETTARKRLGEQESGASLSTVGTRGCEWRAGVWCGVVRVMVFDM